MKKFEELLTTLDMMERMLVRSWEMLSKNNSDQELLEKVIKKEVPAIFILATWNEIVNRHKN